MITLVRIDDRLLHGQVAYSWKSKLSYDAIVIVSNTIVNDELRKEALKLATPEGVRLAIRSIEDGAKLLKNPKLKEMKVLVIVGDTKTALELFKIIDEKPVLNIGGIQKTDNKIMLAKALYVNDEDMDNLDEIVNMGIEVEAQEVPTTPVYKYIELRKKYIKGGN